MNFDSKVLDKYDIDILSFSNLPDTVPHGGFWVISEKCIVPCEMDNCTHYGTALILLSSLGIAKFKVRLKYLLLRYGSLRSLNLRMREYPWIFDSLDYEVNKNSNHLTANHFNAKLSYEEVYLAMHKPPLNAVRMFCNVRQGYVKYIDIITPFSENKKNIALAKDISMLYNKECNIYNHLG